MPVTHHVLRLAPGELLKESLQAFAKTHDIEAGWIVTAVGSLTDTHLRFANREAGTRASGHFEIVSLTGTLATSGAHLHMSVADGTGHTFGGHLLDGNRVYTTVELVIARDAGKRFAREVDPTYGYRELVVYPRDSTPSLTQD